MNGKPLECMVDESGNIFITKGVSETYPCITAHLDTVHGWGNIVVVEKDGALSSPAGIGGDDKCGIFICLELLDKLPILKVAFFQGEEVGCTGSRACDLEWFKNCRYIIGIDRRGNSDFISSFWGEKTASKHFKKTIAQVLQQYEYSASIGLITDSLKLAERKVGISCCNISCGYYNPHCNDESVVIKDVFKALNLTADLIAVLGDEVYSHAYTTKTYTTYTNNKDWSKWGQCAKCKSWKDNTVWLVGVGLVCPECLRNPLNQKKLPLSSTEPANKCDICPFKDKLYGTCLATDKDKCLKEDEEKNPCINCNHIRGFSEACKNCTEEITCDVSGCPKCIGFNVCNKPQARATRIKQMHHEKDGEINCDECRAEQFFQPEWCEDCRLDPKKPTPEFME
jgi:hypothetical protein